MSELLFEDDLKKLLEECENMVTTENYVVDEYTKERDREIELAKKNGAEPAEAPAPAEDKPEK